MNRQRWIKWTRGLALVAVLALPLLLGVQVRGGSDWGFLMDADIEKSQLTPEQAADAARKVIAQESESDMINEWNGSVLDDPVAHYDLKGSVVAYVFSVLKDGTDVGYVTISSRQQANPVLEYSTSMAWHKQSLSPCHEIAVEQDLVLDLAHPLYLGALSYYYAAYESEPSQGNTSSLTLLIDMGDLRQVKPSETMSIWEVARDVSSTSMTVSDTAVPEGSKQLSVPVYYQHCYGICFVGCTPNAAGTVMGYWADRGFPDLMYGGSGGDHVGTINALHDAMGTFCCCGSSMCDPYNGYGFTYDYPVSPGMIDFAASRGYNVVSEWHSSPTYSQYVQEIESDRPMVITFVNGDLGGHTYTGFGYDNNSGQYMIVQPNLVGHDPVWVQYGSGQYGTMHLYTFNPCECCCCPGAGSNSEKNAHFCSSDIGDEEELPRATADMPLMILTLAPIHRSAPTVTPMPIEMSEPPVPISMPIHQATIEPQCTPPASTSYRISKSVFGSGGGEKVSTHYVMNSTQGQSTDLSRRTSASYVLVPGYWSLPTVDSHKVYLPLVVKNR